MISVTISGTVFEDEGGIGLPGLFVKAYDEDLVFDDLLGSAYTRADGSFEIVSESRDFREFFDVKPDIYLRVYAPDAETVLYTTEEAVRVDAGRIESFEVRIPRDRLGDQAPEKEIGFEDDRGEERTDFDVGESLSVRIEGVQPTTAHELALLDESGEELFESRLTSDGNGVLGGILWPQMGLDDPRTGERLSVEEARETWAGSELTVEVRQDDRIEASRTLAVADTFDRPLLLSVEDEGSPVNGFEVGSRGVDVAAYNVPFDGRSRVYMVERQHDWRPGDHFEPVRLESGRPAFVDVDIDDDESGGFRATMADAEELAPGAYDFVVRRLRYGYEDDQRMRIREADLVTRRLTGVVIREEFMASKAIREGCVNKLPISGRHLIGSPYFQYADTFQVGEDVWGALDPAALDPGQEGKMVALYVIQNKSSSEWTADSSVSQIPELGSAPTVMKTQSFCINANDQLLWPNATSLGEYDIVADFGNNTTTDSAFIADSSLDTPLDIVDGYFLAGFRIVPDPTTDTQYPHAGTFEYNDGPTTVTDSFGTTRTVDRKAVVYFPADSAGATTPSQISAAHAEYPLVVVAHGNSSYTTSYQGYEYLLEHLARNGIIAASFHMEPGMAGTDRAELLLEHVDLLKTKFGSRAANNVGIMGHSRGGEAVAIAARLNHEEGHGHDINAVISLSPTDQYTSETLGGAWATPYFVMYGSMDGDVAGGWGAPMNTGFALYDRANGAEKSMAFVYGATHGRFNTVWGDVDLSFGKIGPSDHAELISAPAHRTVATGYMTGFFRQHLLGESQWEGIFTGEWVPAAVEAADGGSVELYLQYGDVARREVDNFEETHTPTSWQTSTIGGTVSDDGTLPTDPQEDELYDLDNHSPHDTSGLLLRWDDTTDRTRFEVPADDSDVSGYDAVSFRVTQTVGSASNPTGEQDLYLTLTDGSGTTRSAKVSKFGAIPPPHERHYSQYTKSAMTTVRIPLSAFTIKVAGAEPIDTEEVASLTFDYNANATGEIEIDSVEFTD